MKCDLPTNVRNFYEFCYPLVHPNLDIGDVEWKFEAMKSFMSKVNIFGMQNAQNILEIGCGSGKLLERFSSFFKVYGFGIDISQTILIKAKEMSRGLYLIQGDAEKLPIKLERFDAIYFADLLEHLEKPNLFLKSLNEAKAILMLIPLESGWIADLIYQYRKIAGKRTNYESYGHLHRWNRKDCLQMLKRNGLLLKNISILKSGVSPCYTTWRGKLFKIISDFFSFFPRFHELLFGGYVLIALYKGHLHLKE